MIVAVSGNIGSGKTTLAKGIASLDNMYYIPQKRLEIGFLNNFFQDIEGYFLPAQLSFLISKAIELQDAINQNKDVIIDRSILEDIEVFARLWIENRNIDEKIVQLYLKSANFIMNSLPGPDLYLFCKCSPELSKRRIASRPQRDFERLYPSGHIEMLDNYYSDFISKVKSPLVAIDAESIDFRDQKTLADLWRHIFDRFSNNPHMGQLSLFDSQIPNESNLHAVFLNFEESRNDTNIYRKPKLAEYIYVAAPFTQMTSNENEKPSAEETNLFADIPSKDSYGILPKDYQNLLKNIEKSVSETCNIPVFLPHRDINNWGKTKHPSETITPQIVETISNASAVLAIPGYSLGVHLEVGAALAKRIPVLIFDAEDLPGSFFVKGFAELPFVKYVKVSSMRHIPESLCKPDVVEFLSLIRQQ